MKQVPEQGSNRANIIQRDVRACDGIVQIVRKVGKYIGAIYDLTLQSSVRSFGELASDRRFVERGRVPCDSLASRPREIEPSKLDEGLLDGVDDRQRMNIRVPTIETVAP
jgi:hypothetical protein